MFGWLMQAAAAGAQHQLEVLTGLHQQAADETADLRSDLLAARQAGHAAARAAAARELLLQRAVSSGALPADAVVEVAKALAGTMQPSQESAARNTGTKSSGVGAQLADSALLAGQHSSASKAPTAGNQGAAGQQQLPVLILGSLISGASTSASHEQGRVPEQAHSRQLLVSFMQKPSLPRAQKRS